jgi:hypothetical protein
MGVMKMQMIEVINVTIQLVIGAAASFLAILVWTKVRDLPWMLIVIGTIAGYAATVFVILTYFGIGGGVKGNVYLSFPATLVSCVPTLIFIAAFGVMIARKFHK